MTNVEEVTSEYKSQFNKLATHPLQSWEWGEFRQKTGIKVVRLGIFHNEKLTEAVQFTVHPIPFTKFNIGYLPKSGNISQTMLKGLSDYCKKLNCIFIKLEPNITKSHWKLEIGNWKFNLVPSPHPLFTKYTFQLNLTKSEEDLLKAMHPKTRYNIRVAQKNGVTVSEDNSPEAFSNYLKLMTETTIRQKFFAHNARYHNLMWETLRSAKIAHLYTAVYHHENKRHVLAAWILFLFNGCLYYPYGASSVLFKKVMASNLMMWEAIKFGKNNKAKLFDMWGSLGFDASPKDSWYGFHKFKLGYGPTLMELAGSFD
ncbi:peptidoglycan bridge formation glycyltransferase FemA/FemB family protein, partial [Candidatus Gottesmanbacteria bacterium]|nr:peptidoglycan bridge formation glycyltransferase FemA/FemB family protein [Candidatus Gottesmanbacteria bacterium]